MSKTIPDRIPSNFSETYIKDVVADRILHEDTRKHIVDIINEYAKTVDFMKLVRSYAAEEMDSRIFRTAQYWITTIMTAIITSAIGFGIAFFLK